MTIGPEVSERREQKRPVRVLRPPAKASTAGHRASARLRRRTSHFASFWGLKRRSRKLAQRAAKRSLIVKGTARISRRSRRRNRFLEHSSKSNITRSNSHRNRFRQRPCHAANVGPGRRSHETADFDPLHVTLPTVIEKHSSRQFIGLVVFRHAGRPAELLFDPVPQRVRGVGFTVDDKDFFR